MNYTQYWEQIYAKQDELNALTNSYWINFSSMGDWQFWLIVFLLIAPLVLLYFTVDRKRILELFFFGYTVHILWTYADIALEENSYFVHTYFLTPMLPNAVNMTASALPVAFLLLYQYCTHRNKNFYLYVLLLSAVFSFILVTIEKYMGLVDMRKGFSQFYIFLIDVGIAYSAYWLTRFMLKVKGKNASRNRDFNWNLFKQKAR